MEELTSLAREHGLLVVEDAAQVVGAQYRGRALGIIGHVGCVSFHATKSIVSGEGGALRHPDLAGIALNARRLVEAEHGYEACVERMRNALSEIGVARSVNDGPA